MRLLEFLNENLSKGQLNALNKLKEIQKRYPNEEYLPLDRTGIQRKTLVSLKKLGYIDIQTHESTHYASRAGFGSTKMGYNRASNYEWTVKLLKDV